MFRWVVALTTNRPEEVEMQRTPTGDAPGAFVGAAGERVPDAAPPSVTWRNEHTHRATFAALDDADWDDVKWLLGQVVAALHPHLDQNPDPEWLNARIAPALWLVESFLSFEVTRLGPTWVPPPPILPREEQTPPGVDAEMRQRVLADDDYTCRRCGTHDDLTVDHISPRARGGTHDRDNLQTLCRRCNSIKGSDAAGWSPL